MDWLIWFSDDDHDEDTSPESEAIFSAARTARDNFNEVNDKYKDTESRIEFINEQLKFEFGENDIFITMYKVCHKNNSVVRSWMGQF